MCVVLERSLLLARSQSPSWNSGRDVKENTEEKGKREIERLEWKVELAAVDVLIDKSFSFLGPSDLRLYYIRQNS